MSEVISKLETSREDVIRELVKFDLETFASMPMSELDGWISHTLLHGYKGFLNMTDSELQECYEEVRYDAGRTYSASQG